ncbi:Trans-aconitate 2-methyltransferase [metagenome]|uniref:Trans-aconitate 2-methyltransferase n=1 Tax=metagenome TaxID=256318 RepID=A0A2P2CBH7_9ZZZZ
MSWDPEHYLTFADERGRPFVDLVNRIPATEAVEVMDLGCGPGNLTRLLARRWPSARVRGVDSSPEMIATAARVEGLEVEVADLRDWLTSPGEAVDVLVSNATLQWVPDHLALLPALVRRVTPGGWLAFQVPGVTPGGWLAFQVPGHFDEPSHTLRRELADEEPYREHTRGVDGPDSHASTTYLQALTGLGCVVDAWETTYLHVLSGVDPVFTWVSGTGARPTLEALEPVGLRAAYEQEFKARLAAAYPTEEYGVVLPFRRVFVVAQVPA